MFKKIQCHHAIWIYLLGSLSFCSYLQLPTQAAERAAKHSGTAVGTEFWDLLLLKMH